jgi:ATP-dependent DNA ligase
MKPLLAHIYEPKRYLGGPCHLQPKLNGVRALGQAGHFQSRDEMPWNPDVLAHLGLPLRDIFPTQLITDGELYVHGWPLQKINGAVAINRGAPTLETAQVEYHIFDQVKYGVSFEERFDELRTFVSLLQGTNIRLVPTVKITEPLDAENYYMKWVGEDYEGMMYRIGSCLYTVPKQDGGPFGLKFLSDKDNRVWHMLKRKDWHDDEFKIVDVEEGEGKRSGMVGAFVCETATGARFRVGSGFTDIDATFWWNNSPVGKRAKVKYLTLTTEGRPFNPTIEAVL